MKGREGLQGHRDFTAAARHCKIVFLYTRTQAHSVICLIGKCKKRPSS